MIDIIVEIILSEAEKRKGTDKVANVYAVTQEVDKALIEIIADMREKEGLYPLPTPSKKKSEEK